MGCNHSKIVQIRRPDADYSPLQPKFYKRRKTVHKFNLPPIPAEISHNTIAKCNHCLGCLSSKRSNFVLKGILGLEYHKKGLSATFTYEDQFLPLSAGVVRTFDSVQLKKRIRSFFSYHFPSSSIDFAESVEYGDRFHRLHLHLNIFGVDENDLKSLGDRYNQIGYSRRGYPIYESDIFEKLWHAYSGKQSAFSSQKKGFVRCQPLHENHVKYIASYNSKSLLNIPSNLSSFDFEQDLLEYKRFTKIITEHRSVLNSFLKYRILLLHQGSTDPDTVLSSKELFDLNVDIFNSNLSGYSLPYFARFESSHSNLCDDIDIYVYLRNSIKSLRSSIKHLYKDRSSFDHSESCKCSPRLGFKSLSNHLGTSSGTVGNHHIPSSWLRTMLDKYKIGDYVPLQSELGNILTILINRRLYYIDRLTSVLSDPSILDRENLISLSLQHEKLLQKHQEALMYSHHCNSA